MAVVVSPLQRRRLGYRPSRRHRQRTSPLHQGGGVIEREYVAICEVGHRGYLRLRTQEPQRIARCPNCEQDARLMIVPPTRPRLDPTFNLQPGHAYRVHYGHTP